jgi:GNAT superfamily N-acetyltransferase
VRYTGTEVLAAADALADAVVEVFGAPPWGQRDKVAFLARLEEDARRPGFAAVLSFSGSGAVEGFATGWITAAPFRTDRAYGEVTARLGPERVADLLVGAFEVDELGVRDRARGTGLGRRLLAELTACAPQGRAWLLTSRHALDAVAFYRRAGWWEPEARPGAETDVTVFLSPAHAGTAV